MDIREVGVVGLGTMGAGIAEVFARAGLPVTAVEAHPAALSKGMSMLDRSLRKLVSRGRLTQDEYAEIAGRVTAGQELASLSGADLVIEVVPEQLEIKHTIIAGLDQVLSPSAIIATNTSSLSVTAIAAGSAHPGRVVGMHFFNPAPVMRLVEVVTTVLTEQAAADAVTSLATRLGKTPVQVSDRAGFVANALLLPFLNHAARLFETGCATRDDIDLAVTAGIGLPMGPLALLDLIGLDTSLAILEVLEREFGGSRYVPAPLLRRLTDAGRTGRKSGSGFYEYGEPGRGSAADSTPEDYADLPTGPGTVTLIDPAAEAGAGNGAGPGAAGAGQLGPHSDRAADLASQIAAAGISVTRNPAHSSDLVIIAIGPEGGVLGPATASGRATGAVGVHLPVPGLAELVPTPFTSDSALATARALLARLGLRVICSADRPGLLVGALLFAHLRDAVAMVADGYTTPKGVDTAMTLGCGYPRGPMRLLADAGPDEAIRVLAAMHAGYGDPAFAPPPLLHDYAAGGVALAGSGD
ncbi:MAG TPA: 3-hydroxyacyl-CoA dehydrogenase NAD-binding domain-containing protein [Streptosporangiaceae bacterium]|nr:3-hydroxyacyl-CoA dehydrogenase NAD-binding domain-containing protein [Streptosporangiaceae bacterium]